MATAVLYLFLLTTHEVIVIENPNNANIDNVSILFIVAAKKINSNIFAITVSKVSIFILIIANFFAKKQILILILGIGIII